MQSFNLNQNSTAQVVSRSGVIEDHYGLRDNPISAQQTTACRLGADPDRLGIEVDEECHQQPARTWGYPGSTDSKERLCNCIDALLIWSGRVDLNHRPPRPERGALPG